MTLAELELEAEKLGITSINIHKPGKSWVSVVTGSSAVGSAEGDSMESALMAAIGSHEESHRHVLTVRAHLDKLQGGN